MLLCRPQTGMDVLKNELMESCGDGSGNLDRR